MSITIREDDTVLFVWGAAIVPPAPRRGDFLAVMKVSAQGQLETTYRFRYADDKLFDSDDEKSFWRVGPVEDSPERRASMAKALRNITRLAGFVNVSEREVNGGAEKFFEVMTKMPGFEIESRAEGNAKA